MNFNEKFKEEDFIDLSTKWSIISGANKNLARAIPDIFDGLKIVARRGLYVLFKNHDNNGRSFVKLATISGDTAGKLHHHGIKAISDALVLLAQPWKNSISLIDGKGNFGNCIGDIAAADRYIAVKISDFAYECYFRDWKDSVVDMKMGADNKTMEPIYLPAKYPVMILNGSIGIGYGASTDIPPFNFSEVIDATIRLIKDENEQIVLIPDSPTGCDIVNTNFNNINRGYGTYKMRATFDINPSENSVTITSLPYNVDLGPISKRINEIKDAEEKGKDKTLSDLINVEDSSGIAINYKMYLKRNTNPHKFIEHLINVVPSLETSYSVQLTFVNELNLTFEMSIKDILMHWINHRRDQKRISTIHKRTRLFSELRTTEVKIFITDPKHLNRTIEICKSSRNRDIIIKALIDEYGNTNINMDSIQAKIVSGMSLYELSEEENEYQRKEYERIKHQLDNIDSTLSRKNGIDEMIIDELQKGIEKFGYPRRSNIVPVEINRYEDVKERCMIHLTSDGIISRTILKNADKSSAGYDPEGFTAKTNNDDSFCIIDEDGFCSIIDVREVPVNEQVPVSRYMKRALDAKIIGLIPILDKMNNHCLVVSKKGIIKRMPVTNSSTRKPIMKLVDGDKIIRAVEICNKTNPDVVIYTSSGLGQRLDPQDIKVTSINANGSEGIKLKGDEEISGVFTINPNKRYLLYTTLRGKMRLNRSEYLPNRADKHEELQRLIEISDRDTLISMIGCDHTDIVQVTYDDGTSEVLDMDHIPEMTMSGEAKKYVQKNTVSSRVIKVKVVK